LPQSIGVTGSSKRLYRTAKSVVGICTEGFIKINYKPLRRLEIIPAPVLSRTLLGMVTESLNRLEDLLLADQ
jgi:hypothetical protein